MLKARKLSSGSGGSNKLVLVCNNDDTSQAISLPQNPTHIVSAKLTQGAARLRLYTLDSPYTPQTINLTLNQEVPVNLDATKVAGESSAYRVELYYD